MEKVQKKKFTNKLKYFNIQIAFCFIAILVAFVLPQQLLAADGQDLEPPVLADIIVSPAEIDVTGGSATVTVTISVTDDLSGFQSGDVRFLSPLGGVNKILNFTINDQTGGTAINGTYEKEIVFPQFSEAGDWDLTQVFLRDVTTNSRLYSNTELNTSGLDRIITVTSDPDTIAPLLEDISFSSPVVMDDDSLSVTMTATVIDEKSGFNSGYFFMRSPSGQNKTFSISSNNLVEGNAFSGIYSTTVSLPQYSEADVWVMTGTTNLRDKAGNVGRVNPADFSSATFTVTTLPDDVDGPKLKAFSNTKIINTITGPDTATFTAQITDNTAGHLYMSASIVSPSHGSPSGGQIHYLGWGASMLIDGDANDGIYEFNKLFPQYSEYGEWTIPVFRLRDLVENITSYDAAAIESLGFNVTLKVSGIKADGSGTYTVDSAGGTINTNDGILEVDFPADAVDDGQEITITSVGEFDPVDIKIGTSVLGEGNVIAEYIFDPDGIVFDEPVTVTMTIDVTEFNANKRNRLGVYLNVDTDGDGVEDTFELINSTVETIFNSDDTVDMVFVFQLDHFSTYAVIEEIVITSLCGNGDLDGTEECDDGNTDNGDGCSGICLIENEPPVADANGPYTIDEGNSLILDASGSSDPDGDSLTYSWDLDYNGVYGDETGVTPTVDWATLVSFGLGDNGLYTIGLQVDDGLATDTDTTTVEILNVAPVITDLTVSPELIEVGSSVDLIASFTDNGTEDTHTATIDWGDSSLSDAIVTETNGSGTVTGSNTYNDAGVYMVTLTVEDDDGGSGSVIFQYVIVYDPSAGFVTGGGWIDSPEGAYVPDTSLTGKANFGFVSKYKKGSTVPQGNTEFQFHAGDLNFHSSTYQWLVVAGGGTVAKFKGEGTINGENDINGNAYKFQIWAHDDSDDTFRIKIWSEDADAIETIIYDNGFDQEISGGQIVIHTSKK